MNAVSYIVEVSVENFQDDVVQKSQEVPVVLEFYADGHEPSVQFAPVIRRLAEEYQGKFVLARVDVQCNPQIVQQLGVRALPTLKIIFQGQMAQDLEGPQDEAALRTVLDQLTQSPMERIREQLDYFLSEGDRQNAIAMLQQLIGQEPNNYALHAELCDLLIMEGRGDEAKQILAGLPADTEGINKPKNRLAFMEEAESLAPVATLEAALQSGEDPTSRYQLAVRLVADDQIEAALECLLTLLKHDKEWEDEKARKTMIKVFDLLGKGNEVATAYRRKMFTFLH